MGINFRQILFQKKEPELHNVLWLNMIDKKPVLKVFNNGEWQIIAGGSTGVSVQSDWDINDPKKEGFIKNKPDLNIYVEKEKNKGLSSNDFTKEYIDKINYPTTVGTFPESTEVIDITSEDNENVYVRPKDLLPVFQTSCPNDNLINGEAKGSLRSITSAAEDDNYKLGEGAVAFGYDTKAGGNYSFAEGQNTIAESRASHAEGIDTTASGRASHAEGSGTKASGGNSHAEGGSTTASGFSSHAEGNSTIASGFCSHAEGNNTIASGNQSHAGGFNTIASHDYQTAIGKYNKDTDSYFSIGNGDYSKRSDAFRVEKDGSIIYLEEGSEVKLQDKFSNINTSIGNIDTILTEIIGGE